MMNTLVCISDCHLGYRHRFKLQRLLDYANAFNDAIAKANSFNPDIIVFGGDIFHHPKPDPKSMRIVIQSLIKLAERCQIVVCIGNHEISGHLGTTYAPLYSDLHRNIHVLTTENPHITLKLHGKSVGFHGFQFLRSRNSAEDSLSKISSGVEGNDINILCIHQALERYLSPYEISLKSLREVSSKYDLILLGHVHKFQRINEIADITPAYYTGSTERISFNEWRNENGFVVFENFDFRNPKFVKVESASMKQIKEKLDKKTPQEINSYIEQKINENKGVKLLQIDLEADINGDFLDIMHDFEHQHQEFTVLDVNVTPKLTEKTITIEKQEINQDLINEYFQKAGLSDQEDLKNMCIDLYQKYAE